MTVEEMIKELQGSVQACRELVDAGLHASKAGADVYEGVIAKLHAAEELFRAANAILTSDSPELFELAEAAATYSEASGGADAMTIHKAGGGNA